MRKSVVEVATLTALLLGAALAWGQQAATPVTPAPSKDAPKDQLAKSKLEVMLQKALQDNPDVRLATAKLAEAEAELNRARLLVVQKVAVQYQAVEAQEAAVDGAAAELKEMQKSPAAVTNADLRAAEQKLIDAKAKLASLEAEIPYLLGQTGTGRETLRAELFLKGWQKSSDADDADMVRLYLDVTGRLPTPAEVRAAASATPSVQGPTADRIRAALDKPFTYECKDKPIADVLRDMNKAFQEASSGLLIKDSASDSLPNDEQTLSVHFDKMPFGAALEWVEDSLVQVGLGTEYRVVIRDYGIVIARKEQLPPGAPLLHDFWKGGKAEKKAAPAPKSPTNIEGKITAYRDDGKVVLNIGGDAGVSIGDEFVVYQPGKDPGTDVKMGPVRVTEVSPKQSVAALAGVFMTLPQQSWRVVRVEHNP